MVPVPAHHAPARSLATGWPTALAVVVAALLALPVLTVAASLLSPSVDTLTHLWWTVLGEYVANSLLLVAGVLVGVVVLGVPTAWLVTMCEFPGRRAFEWLLVLPLAMPAYVMAYAYTDFLQFAGPLQSAVRAATGWRYGDYWFPEVRSLGGAVAMLSLVLYPYVFLLARATFLSQSVCVLEAGRTLGMSPWRCFLKVGLPLARPGIVAGTALALMETLADFGTVAYFGVPTLTTGIYRAWFSLGDRLASAQLSAVLISCVVAVLAVEVALRGGRRFHHTTGRYRRIVRLPVTGLRGWLAALLCALPTLLGFLAPLAILVSLAAAEGEAAFGRRFFELAQNSLVLATVGALVTVAVAALLAYAARLRRNRLTRGALTLAGLGYAIPGSVIAVGTMIPLVALDNAVDGWMRATFGLSTGLLLTGTIAALVYAYVVRFLAVGLQSVESGLTRITPSVEDAARTLGARPLTLVRRIHLPLMAGSLLTSALIVFVDVMKELPATLLIRPFNFDTLAVQTYQLAADERLGEAAGAALAIVAAGLLPVVLLSAAIMRSRPGAEQVAAEGRAGNT